MAPGPVHHQQQLKTTNTTSSTDLKQGDVLLPTQEEAQVCTRLMSALLECRLQEALASETLSISNQPMKIYSKEFDKKSKFVTCYDRDRMVRWLCVLTHDFHYCLEVFFRATSILDAFLSVMSVRHEFLQIVTATCFFAASKLEEVPESVETVISDMVNYYNCAFTPNDIHKMELTIIQKLDFKINYNTPYDFLKIFHILGLTNGSLSLPSGLSHDQHLCHTALCLEEIVSNHLLMKFRPSLLALAVLGCDLKLLGCDWLTAVVTLQNLSGVRGGELSVCYEAVAPQYNLIAIEHPLYISSPTDPPSPPAPTPPLANKEGDSSPDVQPDTKTSSTAAETKGEKKEEESKASTSKEKEEKAKDGTKGSVGGNTTAPSSGGTTAMRKKACTKGKPGMLFPKSAKTVAV